MSTNFIFSTHNNEELVGEILGKTKRLKKGKCLITHYKDGEILVHVGERVKNKKVYVLGSTFSPAENVLELIILINALKENGANKIIVLVPYFGYGKQDRKKYSGDAMSAKLMVRIIEDAGADEFITLDLHSHRIEEYFRKKLTHLSAIELLANYCRHAKFCVPADCCVVAPDDGGVKRADQVAKILGINKIVLIKKFRPAVDKSRVVELQGEVKNKNCVIVDDMAQTGGTLIEAAKILKHQGAQNIYVVVTHLVATGPVVKNLRQEKNIKKIITTNSIVKQRDFKGDKKFAVVSVADLFGKSI